MSGRKGAYNILKGMNMSVPGATNDADSTDIPEYQQNDAPVKVTSSIKLQPVNTSSGIQLQTMPAQGASTNVSTKKITKISVQHQKSGGQSNPDYQQFQQVNQFQQSPQQRKSVPITRQTAVQQRTAQLQNNPGTRMQQQQQQQQQPTQQPPKTVIRLQSNQKTAPQDQQSNFDQNAGYHSVQFNPQPTSSFSSYEPQQKSQESTPQFAPYQSQSYGQQPNDQYSSYQPLETYQQPAQQWASPQFEPAEPKTLKHRASSLQDDDDFEFPAVSRLSNLFRDDKPKRADSGFDSNAKQVPSWQPPSSPRAGRKFPPNQVSQPQSVMPFGSDFTKPPSPKVSRKPKPQQYQPAEDFGSSPQPPWQQQPQQWQPKPSQPSEPAWQASKPPSQAPAPSQKQRRPPPGQPQQTSVPSFGTQFTQPSSPASTQKRPVSQPQPAVPSFGTQYGEPPTGSVILPKRPLSGGQFEPAEEASPYSLDREVQQVTSPFFDGKSKTAQETIIPSFGTQFTPKQKQTEKPSSSAAWRRPPSPKAQARPKSLPRQQSSESSGSYGVQYVPRDEASIQGDIERKRQLLDQQEADTCQWTVDDIKKRVSKLRTDLFNSRDENQELHEEMRKLNKLLNELKIQYEFSEKQKQALEYKSSELTDQLHDLKSQESTLKMDLEQAQTENDRTQRDLVRARESAEALHDTNSANTRMRMELGHVQGEHSRVRAELERISADKKELTDSLLDANSSYNQLKMELDLMNDNIGSLQRSLLAAETERNMLWDRLAKAQRDKQQMMEELMLSTDESY